MHFAREPQTRLDFALLRQALFQDIDMLDVQARDDRIRGNQQGIGNLAQRHFDGGKTARQNFAAGILGPRAQSQRSRGLIDPRLTRVNFSGKRLGDSRHRNLHFGSRLHAIQVAFGDGKIHFDRVDLLQRRDARRGIDERADAHVAKSDDTVERCANLRLR